MNVIVWRVYVGLCCSFHKVPGWKPEFHCNGHFSAKNIRFKIRKIENLVKSPLEPSDYIRTDSSQPKIFGSKLEK